MTTQTTTRKLYRRSGTPGLQTLNLATEEISLQTPTEILIHVHAISLNYRDANILHGTNPWPVSSHGIPCSDAAGSVLSIGASVTRFKVGDKVCSILDQESITGKEQERLWLGGETDGVLASHLVVDQELCVKIPEGLSWKEAACLPNAGVTAWSALGGSSGLRPGMTILIQGKLLFPAVIYLCTY